MYIYIYIHNKWIHKIVLFVFFLFKFLFFFLSNLQHNSCILKNRNLLQETKINISQIKVSAKIICI